MATDSVRNEPYPVTNDEFTQTVLKKLREHGLDLQNGYWYLGNMIRATQKLKINENTICSDELLIERICYRSSEQLHRELSTLTIKKNVFADHEETVTSIPKYCFISPQNNEAILVHSVPWLSLHELLKASDRIDNIRFITDKAAFYREWVSLICSRLKSCKLFEKNSKLSKFSKLRTVLLPAPFHITCTERKRFCIKLISTLQMHHRSNIFHNYICTKTIFLINTDQVEFLSNYSGVISSMQQDFLPHQLFKDESAELYGPQLIDTYSMALVCYRIITGKFLSGRKFSIDSPRPFRIVFAQIVKETGFSPRRGDFPSFSEFLLSFLDMVARFTNLLVPLLSCKHFVAWRRLNRATGSLFRSIPIFGEFADILLPTRTAVVLRYILDQNWFHFKFNSKDGNRPDLSFLLKAFTPLSGRKCKHYQHITEMLKGESIKKRYIFEELMEPLQKNSTVKRMKQVLPFSGAISALLFLLLTIRLITAPSHHFSDTTAATTIPVNEIASEPDSQCSDSSFFIESSPNSSDLLVEILPDSALFVKDIFDSISDSNLTVIALRESSDSSTYPMSAQILLSKSPLLPDTQKTISQHDTTHKQIPQVKTGNPAKSPAQAAKPKKVPLINPDTTLQEDKDTILTLQVDTLPSNTGHCYLDVISKLWTIYQVKGFCTNCDLANVLFKTENDSMSRPFGENGLERYFLSHKTNDAFGPIIQVRKKFSEATRTQQYFSCSGDMVTDKIADVYPGDLVGKSKSTLNAYIVRNKK